MSEKICKFVKLMFIYDPVQKRAYPVRMRWRNTIYSFTHTSYHYREKKGEVLYHIFYVSDASRDFKLLCNTDTLSWKLMEIYEAD